MRPQKNTEKTTGKLSGNIIWNKTKKIDFLFDICFLVCYIQYRKGDKMNLFSSVEQPILNSLHRIYRRNGRWVEAQKKYKQRGK